MTASDILRNLSQRHGTGLVYFILEGEQPMDGEFYWTEEKLCRVLVHADPTSKVFAMSFEDGTVRDVTEDMVWQARLAGDFQGHEAEAIAWGV